jgi:hypothetical protein
MILILNSNEKRRNKPNEQYKKLATNNLNVKPFKSKEEQELLKSIHTELAFNITLNFTPLNQ